MKKLIKPTFASKSSILYDNLNEDYEIYKRYKLVPFGDKGYFIHDGEKFIGSYKTKSECKKAIDSNDIKMNNLESDISDRNQLDMFGEINKQKSNENIDDNIDDNIDIKNSYLLDTYENNDDEQSYEYKGYSIINDRNDAGSWYVYDRNNSYYGYFSSDYDAENYIDSITSSSKINASEYETNLNCISDWIEIETTYVDENDEDLFDYADKYDEYVNEEYGNIEYPVSYFEFNGERYALDRFLSRWGMVGFDQKCERYPKFIDGYDSHEYFNPLYIELSDDGEYVRLWEDAVKQRGW